jgi:exosortase K
MMLWPWPRIGLLTVLAFALFGLKRHYATAEVGELAWILKPVASLSGLVSGATFEWEPGAGYLSRERLFLIAKPCAGVNFMLAAWGMVGFLLSERARSWRASGRLLAQSLVIGYVATLLANTLRIAVALWLALHPVAAGWWTAARIHRLEGIAVYFGMLVALHRLVQLMTETTSVSRPETWKRRAAFRRARLPLVAYGIVTIFIPLANGSGNSETPFLEHLLFVLLAPPALVAFIALVFGAGRAAYCRLTRDPLPPDSATRSASSIVSVPCPSNIRRTRSA